MTPRTTPGTRYPSPATDPMIRRLFVNALIAGAVAGVVGVVLHFIYIEPLILEGELYETGQRVHFAAGSAQSVAGAPALDIGFARAAKTVGSYIVTWAGFALVLAAGLGLSERAGGQITARSGALWGVMAFLAVNLAPAAGLPPSLPGTVGAALEARQLWWGATIAASLLALVSFGFMRGGIAVAAGLFLLLLPQVLGAPMPGTYAGVAPPELAALFVGRTLGVAALTWAVLGAVLGWLWTRN